MDPITAAEIADHLGAQLIGDGSSMIGPEVVIDSREATAGCLFIALPGERVDGVDFAAAAVANGAAAVVVTRQLDLGTAAQLVVPDAGEALARLAAAVVAAQPRLVSVGVTGSSGKTSTKDLIAQVLAATGTVVAPQGSANNEIGVPLTACKVAATTDFLVSELGARGQGHISWLCDIVKPQVGAVLNVGHAHLGEFGSITATANAKSELVAALPASGWAVLNADDRLVWAMAEQSRAQLASFSVVAEPPRGAVRVWATQIVTDQRQRPSFQLNASGAVCGEAQVSLQVSGTHQVANALAAAAVSLTQSMPLADVAAALSAATVRSRWRMELHDAPSGLLVVNDAYNANPDSMAAALRAVSAMRRPGGRLYAILGDMLELGDGAEAEHRQVGALAAELGFDQLFVVGAYGVQIAEGAAPGGLVAPHFDDPDAAAAAVERVAGGADIVLVKASRGLALETVAGRLSGHAAAESER